jgi:signal transduction histidine kinase
MFGRSTSRRSFPGGLRAQLLLGLLVLVGAAFGLIAVLTLQVVKNNVHSSETELTRMAAHELAARLAADDADTVDVSANFVKQDDVRFAGEWTDGSLEGLGLNKEDVVTAVESASDTTFARRIELGGTSQLIATAPSRDGVAVVVRSSQRANERVDRTRDLLLIYLGVDALFILIVGYGFFTYLVVRPIRAIGVATERAAKGDLASPISLLPPNEFGRVGRSFNEMLEELRSKRDELEERLEELNRANEELSRAQESLIRSEKLASVGQLSAGVAHEIGNPLAAIAGYVEILEDDELDEEIRADILERTGKEVERIRGTIRDLLDFSREDREQEVQDVRVRDCIDEAKNLVEAQPRARDVELDIALPDSELRVRAIESQVVQVLVNLLINAIDAVDEGGRVELSTRTDEDQVTISVCDDGPGVDEDNLQKLFEPFYTTKDPGKGTGLGLAISLRIIKRFGGDIEVDSQPEEGTCFRVVLLASR